MIPAKNGMAGLVRFRTGLLFPCGIALCVAVRLHAATHEVFPGRHAVASVSCVDSCWVIDVSFEPSNALGPAKSDTVNQRLAHGYALRGLARELAGESAGASDMSVSEFRTESSRREGTMWRARFSVPTANVLLHPCPAIPPAKDDGLVEDAIVPESKEPEVSEEPTAGDAGEIGCDAPVGSESATSGKKE